MPSTTHHCALYGRRAGFGGPRPEPELPSKPVRITVPGGPGVVADIRARWLADRLSLALGNPWSRTVPAQAATSARSRPDPAIRADHVVIGLTEAGRDLFVDTAPSGAIHIAIVMKKGTRGCQMAPRELAPATTQAILDGTQPTQLTLADLMQRDIPVD